jgi:hypothetical protein
MIFGKESGIKKRRDDDPASAILNLCPYSFSNSSTFCTRSRTWRMS